MKHLTTFVLLPCLIAACAPAEQTASCQIERRGASQEVVRIQGDCSQQDFSGQDLTSTDVSEVHWGAGATCPDGTRSGDHDNTCLGHLDPEGANPGPQDSGQDASRDVDVRPDASADGQVDPDIPPEDLGPERDTSAPDMPCQANACGGCEALPGVPGESCGPCHTGTWACQGQAIICDDSPACASRLCDSDQDCTSLFDTCQGGFCTPADSVLVPAGTYVRGAPVGDSATSLESPQHQVTLTRPLFVQRYEYTLGQWRQERQQDREVGADEGCPQDNCPLRDITWLQTLAIANHASVHWGLETCYSYDNQPPLQIPTALEEANDLSWEGLDCAGWRLPTSAEWEYFARAGTTTPWSWGEDAQLAPNYAHGDVSHTRPQAVGLLRPNPWGLHDIHGNVAEWVWGTRELYPDPPMHLVDPTFEPEFRLQEEFEVRGGTFDSSLLDLRSDTRRFALSLRSSHKRGLRLVRTVQPQP